MASCLYPTVHSCNLLPLKHLAQVLLPQMRAAGKGYALARSFLPVAKNFTKRGPLFWCGQNWDFWRSHFACHSYTAVQCTDVLYTSTLVHLETVHLYHQSWRQPGLSRGLESKLILTNESTSNIYHTNRVHQYHGLKFQQTDKDAAIQFLGRPFNSNKKKSIWVKKSIVTLFPLIICPYKLHPRIWKAFKIAQNISEAEIYFETKIEK